MGDAVPEDDGGVFGAFPVVFHDFFGDGEFETVGVALTETTILLVLGFSVLTYSAFELNSQNGLMTSITIALALVVDFLFLPGLLIAIDKVKSKRARAAEPAP